MSRDDSIAVALRQPVGAEFRLCALQVNPRHYSGTYRGQPPAAVDDAAYARGLVEKAVMLGITVLAVTDHNHVGGVAAIRAAGNLRSAQRIVSGADHFFHDRDEDLVEAVERWLATLPADG